MTIDRAGIQSTVQDLGRGGYLGDGIPPSGAFDAYSLQLGNMLVGNDPGDRYLVGRRPGAAGIEALLGGLAITAGEDTAVAATGADADITVDGDERPQWESFRLPADATLRVGPTRAGARAYIALAGGIDVPERLGSRATNTRARLGGLEGRQLRKGDELTLGAAPPGAAEAVGREVRPELRPSITPPWELGVVLGPQDHLFTDDSVELFLSTDWKLSQLADRMGCRFEGPALEFNPRPDYLIQQAGSDPSNIVDDVTPLGGIQVPSGLEPIAMGVDFPSIGGYAKIATVISSHMRRLAQIRPGDAVRFRSYSVEEAVDELRTTIQDLETRAIVGPKERA